MRRRAQAATERQELLALHAAALEESVAQKNALRCENTRLLIQQGVLEEEVQRAEHDARLNSIESEEVRNAMGEAVRGLAGKRAAVMLASHGPVVAGKDVEAACNAIEELEDTARLAMMTRGMNPRMLTPGQVRELVNGFDVEWDE